MITVGRRPARLDLALRGGDPIDVAVPILDATGVAVPAAGWTGAALVRASLALDAALLHTFTCSVDAGQVRITATPAQTLAWLTDWAVRVAPWEVTVTDLDDTPHALAAGWVRLSAHN